jgi:3-phenylpropionate/trans-cinnamate dioxygenase ferredoxin reductase subunit
MVVVGAGECGARAAFALRENGWTGPVTLVGAEPLLPYERPPLSKAGLVPDSAGPVAIRDARAYRDADIELVSGVEEAGLDTGAHHVELADGPRPGYERLLLATGASAAVRRGAGAPPADARRRRVAAPALTPGTRVGVIGGGFVGLELAASAAARGCSVTVVELGPRPMGRAVPARIAAVLVARHVAAGVDLRCGDRRHRARVDGDRGHDRARGRGRRRGRRGVAGSGSVPETALAVAKDVRLAEMLIARRAVPDPAALADPSVTLKFLLRSPVGA